MHLSGNTKKKSKGFTIIELLVVIVIIGVLAGIVFVVYKGVVNRANHAAVQAEAKQVNDKLAMYNTEFGSYPNDDTFDGFFDDSCTGDYCFDPDDRFSFDYEYPDDREDYCTDSSDCQPAIEVCDPELEICYGYDPRGELLDLTQPSSCPSGFIPITGSALYSQKGFCVMKYEATKRYVSFEVVSEPLGDFLAMASSPSEADALSESVCEGCHLITESQTLTIKRDVDSQPENLIDDNVYNPDKYKVYQGISLLWNESGAMAGEDDSDGYFNVRLNNGQINIPSRRTLVLSNKEVIWDFYGNLPEWQTGDTASDQETRGFRATKY